MSKQSDAVKAYIEENGLVQKDIAAKMGISPASLNNMLNGRDNIGKRRAQKLHDMFGFDVVYLLTGEGTLFSGPIRHVEVSHNSGSSQNTVSIGDTSDTAALKARVESLEKENSWLRQMLEKLTDTAKRTDL